MYVYLQGTHFQQTNVIITNNNNVINIYVVYKLDPIASTRNDIYTVQNALFCAMEITLTLQNMFTKIMGCALTKAVCLVKDLLKTEGTY